MNEKSETTADERVERAEDALRSILQWAEAYPVDIFPPVDLAAARAKFDDDALFARLHACWARHIVSGIEKHARAGLGEHVNAERRDQNHP